MHDQIQGLSSAEVQRLKEQYGQNVLPRAKQHPLRAIAQKFFSPIPLMLLAAATLSFGLGKNIDGAFILALFAVNAAISMWHERKADRAVRALEARVTTQVRTLRNGTWVSLPSHELVPHDVIELAGGDIVPADAKVLTSTSALANESAITGESLPVEKQVGDTLSMGSFIAGGVVGARITATGGQTRFGGVIARDTGERSQSSLEEDILTISKFLAVVAVLIAAGLSAVLLLNGESVWEVVRLDLSLLIAGVPAALPVVMSVIISVGVMRVADRGAIVRRLAALEDLANVDLLLTDKTGTLTKNQITVRALIRFTEDKSEAELAGLAAATVAANANVNALEAAVRAFASGADAPAFPVHDVVPADAVRKRSTVTVTVDGKPMTVSLGAPQVILAHSDADDALKERFTEAVHDAAARGYRALALSIHTGKKLRNDTHMQLVALLLLSDELHDDAKDVIAFLLEHGVRVKMLTGDNAAVATEIAHTLGLMGETVRVSGDELKNLSADVFHKTDVFAEILPEDKETLVMLAKQRSVVAVTGDGVNDLPAVRNANVGIAVENAVDALKGAADIVLTAEGIGVIRDAVVESRRIFTRIYSYSLYRISESFRVIVTVAVFGALFLVPILTPVQLLILALLNDLPIISLAWNRVRAPEGPAVVDVKRRFIVSLCYGSVGIVNSVLFFLVVYGGMHLPWNVIQTLFFLKLTVSGHMLIFVAHTEAAWFKFLPSRQVLFATVITQAVATVIAIFGVLMTGISPWLAAFVWVWSFVWMQIADLTKLFRTRRRFAFKDREVQSVSLQ